MRFEDDLDERSSSMGPLNGRVRAQACLSDNRKLSPSDIDRCKASPEPDLPSPSSHDRRAPAPLYPSSSIPASRCLPGRTKPRSSLQGGEQAGTINRRRHACRTSLLNHVRETSEGEVRVRQGTGGARTDCCPGRKKLLKTESCGRLRIGGDRGFSGRKASFEAPSFIHVQ